MQSSCTSRIPPHPPLRGTFSPSKAGEKGKGWAAALAAPPSSLMRQKEGLLPHFPSPHEVGRRCPGGADEGDFTAAPPLAGRPELLRAHLADACKHPDCGPAGSGSRRTTGRARALRHMPVARELNVWLRQLRRSAWFACRENRQCNWRCGPGGGICGHRAGGHAAHSTEEPRRSSVDAAAALHAAAASSRLPSCLPKKEPLIRPSGAPSPRRRPGRRENGGAPLADTLSSLMRQKEASRSLLFPSPRPSTGRRCPGGADEGLFSGKHDNRRGDASSCGAPCQSDIDLLYAAFSCSIARTGRFETGRGAPDHG